MPRKKKEESVQKSEENPALKRRIKSFKPKKDIVLSPGFELRKINPRQKWPGRKQWKHFFRVMSRKEKSIFFVLLFLAAASIIFLYMNFYYKKTEPAPARGGIFIEGFHGQPRFINPVYANSDIDRDLTELIFSGLMRYDKDMNIVPDLAEKNPEIEDEGRVYRFYLKENLFWQDGTKLTADDIVFTIKTLQNPDLKSPYLANWTGVKVERAGDLEIKLTLQKPYAAFIENLTVKIIPKHIWENIPAESFPFQLYNMEEAVGSGMYKIKEAKRNGSTQKIDYIILEENKSYSGRKPYIPEIKFVFFNSVEDLIKAAEKGKLTGFDASLGQPNSNEWSESYVRMPRYFALFLNPAKTKLLKEKDVRIVLNYATNKKELGEQTVNSPLLSEFYGISLPSNIYEYDPEKAAQILESMDYKDTDGNGLREKAISKESAFKFKSRLASGSSGKEVSELQKCLQTEETGYFGAITKQAVIAFQEQYAREILEPAGYNKGTGVVGESTRNKLNEICFPDQGEIEELKFDLITVNQPQMEEIAETIKSQWEEVGIRVEIRTYPILQLEQEFIKTRDYEILLFGEVLGAIPDPFPFWHSSQKYDPGLNLSSYENKYLDELLEEGRKISDENLRKENLEAIQNIIIDDIPAIFLYSPKYTYLSSDLVKGISDKKSVNTSKRFIGIEDWYIKTKRVWK